MNPMPPLTDDDAWAFMAKTQPPANLPAIRTEVKSKINTGTKKKKKKSVPYVPAGSNYFDDDGEKILQEFDAIRDFASQASKRYVF